MVTAFSMDQQNISNKDRAESTIGATLGSNATLIGFKLKSFAARLWPSFPLLTCEHCQ